MSKLVRADGEAAPSDLSVSLLGLPSLDFDELMERLVCEVLMLVSFGTSPRSAAVCDCESGVG